MVNLEFENLKREISKTSQDLAELSNNAITYRGYIDAQDINETTESGYYFVIYFDDNGNITYSGALIVIPVGGLVGIIQFYKHGYYGDIPWSYRNAVDSDTNRWTPWYYINATH